MKSGKKLLSLLLSVIMVLGVCAGGGAGDVQATEQPSAAGNGKALQLVKNGAAANIAGAQQSNVYFGNYKQSRNGEDGYNVEPIKWRVLENKDGRLFLLSDQILDDFFDFNEASTGKWEEFHLRRWLNGLGKYETNNFKDSAFTATEYDAIALTDTDVDNIHTQDKVFFLSVDEATNTAYGFEDTLGSSGSRVAEATDYANKSHAGGDWYLRSPSEDLPLDEFSSVESEGEVNTSGRGFVPGSVGERPAFNIDLSKVLFTSAAVGGKADSGLTAVGDYDGADWKLTLLDDSRSGFTASTARLGDEWVITYSGAATGTNEKISAMIVNGSGDVTYYGVLSTALSGTNKVTYNAAGKLHDGDRLYIFNEQRNGDNLTDYASALIDVTDAPVFHEIPKCDLPTLNDGDYWFDIHKLAADENISIYNIFNLLDLSFFYVSADGSAAMIKEYTGNYTLYNYSTYTAGDARFAYLKQHVTPACEVVAFSEEFESVPTGWTFVDADGDEHGWNHNINGSDTEYLVAHSGNGILYSESYTLNGRVDLTPDNWAITPAIVVPEESAALTFWTTGQDTYDIAEHYGVYVYEADPAAPALPAGKPGDYMTKLMEKTNAVLRTYEENTVDLSAYAGKTVFLAFRHFNCTGQFYLDLDSVTVKGIKHTYGDTGADRYTCTVCGTLNETRKAAFLVDPGLTVTVSSATVYYGRTAIVTANLPADATGTVDFTLEGQDIDVVYPITGVPLWNGSATVSDNVYDVGNYHVKAKYSGDDKYKAAEAEAYLEVIRNVFSLDLTMQNGEFTIPYGQPAVVIVTIPEDATHQEQSGGDITLTLNGSAVGTYDAENGVLAFDFTENEKLAPGDYTVHATYNGDGHYAPQEAEITFVVTEATPEIKIEAEPLDEVGTAYEVAITKPADAVGYVTLHVNYNGEEKDVRVCATEFFEDGVFSFNFPEDIPACIGLTGEFTLTADYNGRNDPNYTNNSDEITIRLGCEHVWDTPEWNWDDPLHPAYKANCTKCDDGKAEGTVNSVPGTRVEATVESDAYTPYTAFVTLGTQTFESSYNLVEPGTMQQARADALEDYKAEQKDAADALAQEGDSEECAALIDNAKKAIDEVSYDESKPLDENKQAVDEIIAALEADLEEHRREYTATFVDENGTVLGKVKFTIDTKSIDEPAVPGKPGYTASWEEYELGAQDITVKPVYTPADICPLDNEYHGTSFFGRGIKFIHTVIWKVFQGIGLNLFFKIGKV